MSNKTKKSFMDSYVAWFSKWFPESFFIAMLLTIICTVMALLWTKAPIWHETEKSIIGGWIGGFWGLLAFAMQMTVLLVTGYAVAASPPVTKFLSKLAAIPKNPTQMIIIASIVTAILGYIHWGVGLTGGIMFGRAIIVSAKQRGIKIHLPSLVAAMYLSFIPSSAGISGAAALYSATPDYLKKVVDAAYKDATPSIISLSETVANPVFIAVLIMSVIGCTFIVLKMMPKDSSKIEEASNDFIDEINNANSSNFVADNSTPAMRMNNSPFFAYLFGGIGLVWSIYNIYKFGLGKLTLDNYNFLMLTLGLVLNGNLELYSKNIRSGIDGTWGFAIQFPFYAGIFGIISATGLGTVISHFFTSISTGETFPVIAFIYSALLNIAVPSGGSKFVIEAPYIIPAAIDTGANLATIIDAYQLGDAVTNMIVPFFCLPYLANFRMPFSKIMPYTLAGAGYAFILFCIALYWLL